MDLRKLSVGNAQLVPLPRRRLLIRFGLPLFILIGMAALLLYWAGAYWQPKVPVKIIRAVAIMGSDVVNPEKEVNQVSEMGGEIILQAPGWVEPEPYGVYASALTDGVVKNVYALEGASVKRGQVLVDLIEEDAQLALEKSIANLQIAEAKLTAAKINLAEPTDLKKRVQVNHALLDDAKSMLKRNTSEILEAQAKYNELKIYSDALQGIGQEAYSKFEVEQAEYKVQGQAAKIKTIRETEKSLLAMVKRYKAEVVASEKDFELKVELKRMTQEMQASVMLKNVIVKEAKLRLSRMQIMSPIDGIVMERKVSPGDKVMLGMDGAHSAHVMHLYDPQKLQVRVDVPIADASKVRVGQRAIIIVDVLPNVEFKGSVLRAVHMADIGKNTVQFKVKIEKPAKLLKPEMLARIKFLGYGKAGAKMAKDLGGAVNNHTVIAKNAVASDAQKKYVWVVEPATNSLRKKEVKTGQARQDQWVHITHGLNPGDAVVIDPKSDFLNGQHVQIIK